MFLFVCNLLFIIPLPKQRQWVFYIIRFSWPQTDRTGHSRTQPPVGEKTKERCTQKISLEEKRKNEEKTNERYILRAGPARPSRPLSPPPCYPPLSTSLQGPKEPSSPLAYPAIREAPPEQRARRRTRASPPEPSAFSTRTAW